MMGFLAGFIVGTLALHAAAEDAQKDRYMRESGGRYMHESGDYY